MAPLGPWRGARRGRAAAVGWHRLRGQCCDSGSSFQRPRQQETGQGARSAPKGGLSEQVSLRMGLCEGQAAPTGRCGRECTDLGTELSEAAGPWPHGRLSEQAAKTWAQARGMAQRPRVGLRTGLGKRQTLSRKQEKVSAGPAERRAAKELHTKLFRGPCVRAPTASADYTPG